MEAKISVIIPAYNVAGYLEKCLDSILAQTFTDFEVILINDGSTDDTPAICDRYAEKDKRITVIHKANEGVSIARNTGINQASGKYFLFYDGDDFAEPYAFMELYKLAEDKGVDTVLYGYHRYNKGITETCPPIFKEGLYEGSTILETLLPRFVGISYDGINKWLQHEKNGLYVENPALWRAMLLGDIVRKNNLTFDPNLKVGEDTIFICNYLSYAAQVYVVKKCYYYLVTRESSTIFQYEKNALAKLAGKEALLRARRELTDSITVRCGKDIAQFWQGTVVMSCIELAFLLSKKSKKHSYRQRYRYFRRYISYPEVERAVKGFPLKKKTSVMSLPFMLLKGQAYRTLFLAAAIINRTPYTFQRG